MIISKFPLFKQVILGSIGRNQLSIFFDKGSYASLCILTICLPFTKGGVETGLTLACVFWLYRRLFLFDQASSPIPYFYLYCAFIVACVLSLSNLSYIIPYMKGVQKVIKYFFLYCTAVQTIRTLKRLERLVLLLIVGSALSSLDGFYQYLSGWNFRHSRDYLIYNDEFRISASFNHPNNFAAYLLFMILLTLFIRLDGRLKTLRAVALVGQAFCIIQTGSRSVIYIYLAMLLVIYYIHKEHRHVIRFSLLGACLLTFAQAAFNKSYFFRLFYPMADLTEKMSYWLIAIRMWIEQPLFGVGVNTYMSNFSNYVGSLRVGLSSAYAHSVVMQLLGETGIIGTFLFMLLIVLIFRNIWSLAYRSDSIACQRLAIPLFYSSVALFLHACLDTDLQSLQLSALFWLIVGSMMGVVSCSLHQFSEV